jgi:hypothetical protein
MGERSDAWTSWPNVGIRVISIVDSYVKITFRRRSAGWSWHVI